MSDSEKEQEVNPEVDRILFRRGVVYTLAFVGVLIFVKLLEIAAHTPFTQLGVMPRSFQGSLGILTSPLIHGDMVHLISNGVPLIVLGVGIFYFYPRIAVPLIFWIYITTGFWLWIAGRGGTYHIGASGVVYGLASYLILAGIFRWQRRTLMVSLAITFLYGTGLAYGLMGNDPGISYESHQLGALSGLFFAFYYRKEPVWGLPPSPKKETPEEEELPDKEGAGHHTAHEAEVSFQYVFAPKKEDAEDSEKQTL